MGGENELDLVSYALVSVNPVVRICTFPNINMSGRCGIPLRSGQRRYIVFRDRIPSC